MTATANLTALHAAAVSGDRSAMLCLADLAEEQGDDGRAGAWRWLADPPAEGWERRAAMGLAGAGGLDVDGAFVEGRGPQGQFPARLWCRRQSAYLWDENRGWRFDPESQYLVACSCPAGIRDDILAACRLALAG
jgi:hypothetical protein